MNYKFNQNILIIMIILLGFIFLQNKQSDNIKSNSQKISQSQEYMQGVVVSNFTNKGELKDYIQATSWKYFPEQKYSKLDSPYLQIIKQNGNIWHIWADQGYAKHSTLESKVEELELIDNVIVEQSQTNDLNKKVRISSSQIQYFPDNEFIQTSKYVQLIKPNLKITGNGMSGYLDKLLFEVKNDVITIYNKEQL